MYVYRAPLHLIFRANIYANTMRLFHRRTACALPTPRVDVALTISFGRRSLGLLIDVGHYLVHRLALPV